MPETTNEGLAVGVWIDAPVHVVCPLGERLGILQIFCTPFSTRAYFSDLQRPMSFELELKHDEVPTEVSKRYDWPYDDIVELYHPGGGRARAKLVVFDEYGQPLATAHAGHR